MIDDSLFSLGGLNKDHYPIIDFIEIDIRIRTSKKALINRGGEIPIVFCSAITPVFYQSKMGYDGSL